MIELSQDAYVSEQQMRAVIFCLVAFAYIDADFDPSEKEFIRDHVSAIAEHRAKGLLGELPSSDVAQRWAQHYHEILDEYDRTVRAYFTESVGEGETSHNFVLSRLKLGCFELLQHFDEAGQQAILSAVDSLMHADGVVHPNEQAFRTEMANLTAAPIELDDADIVPLQEGAVVVGKTHRLDVRVSNHPFFNPFEWDWAKDPELFAQQSAGDMELISRVVGTLSAQRAHSAGRLEAAGAFANATAGNPILDGYVYVLPPPAGKTCEMLVIGDLHGCYSCLKGALLQADFFSKVERYQADPAQPIPYVVFLGDYIDRGRVSYSGTLRMVMQLMLAFPGHVFPLRGNHEYYVELHGRVVAPVRPCEAMDSIKAFADNAIFASYMRLFEALPTSLVFDRILFVHGGIPRTDTLEEKWQGIHSLNDADIRFQMLWSDPSSADVIPVDLQRESTRFPFGKRQFQHFMSLVGCSTMIRGHERVTDGFRVVYDDPEGVLLTLFSAGGATNDDLPEKSNYREVTPKALIIHHEGGIASVKPFDIDYARFNDPRYNAFFRNQVSG